MARPRDLTPEEEVALHAFARAHGRQWKERLGVYWYNARIWDGQYCLHALRNDPRWGVAGLAAYRMVRRNNAEGGR